MKPLCVVLVTYRRFEIFKRTLESLLPTLPYESKVLIVHNPTGEHAEGQKYAEYYRMLKEHQPEHCEIIVHVTSANEGWGKAMNEGLSKINWQEYEYVLESNNDVEYEHDWFAKATAQMRTYREIGILGLWSHPHHGVRSAMWNGLVIKDNMPACAWLFRSKDLTEFLPFKERGACNTRGGNGEDTDMVLKVQNAGRWVCGLKNDLAHHIDGYDIPELGKVNPAYE